ncbi:hypothetical protein MPER_15765, partial [Moniliophthora perniciosa FA553]
FAQRLNISIKQTLPLLLFTTFQRFATDKEVNRISLLRSFDPLFERKRKYARVVSEPPDVCFASSKSSAVDTRLLTSSKANDSTVEGIGNTVGLGVFECKSGDNQIGQCRGWQLEL